MPNQTQTPQTMHATGTRDPNKAAPKAGDDFDSMRRETGPFADLAEMLDTNADPEGSAAREDAKRSQLPGWVAEKYDILTDQRTKLPYFAPKKAWIDGQVELAKSVAEEAELLPLEDSERDRVDAIYGALEVIAGNIGYDRVGSQLSFCMTGLVADMARQCAQTITMVHDITNNPGASENAMDLAESRQIELQSLVAELGLTIRAVRKACEMDPDRYGDYKPNFERPVVNLAKWAANKDTMQYLRDRNEMEVSDTRRQATKLLMEGLFTRKSA